MKIGCKQSEGTIPRVNVCYLCEILLTQQVFVGFDVPGVSRDPDPTTLTPTVRFQDVGLVFLLASIRLKVSITAINVSCHESNEEIQKGSWAISRVLWVILFTLLPRYNNSSKNCAAFKRKEIFDRAKQGSFVLTQARGKLTQQVSTMNEEICCSLLGTASACGSCSEPVSLSDRFHSCQENGWFSANAVRAKGRKQSSWSGLDDSFAKFGTVGATNLANTFHKQHEISQPLHISVRAQNQNE